MKLVRLGGVGAERPAVLAADGRLLDLSGITHDVDGAFGDVVELEVDGLGRQRQRLDQA